MNTFKLLAYSPFILFIYTTFAQENANLTTAVNKKFSELYPKAPVKKIDQKKSNKVEVQFVENNLDKRAYFDSDGAFLYTERDIELDNVPQQVILAFRNSQWKAWKIDKIVEASIPEHAILYVIKVRQEDYKMYLYYDENGVLHNASSKIVF